MMLSGPWNGRFACESRNRRTAKRSRLPPKELGTKRCRRACCRAATLEPPRNGRCCSAWIDQVRFSARTSSQSPLVIPQRRSASSRAMNACDDTASGRSEIARFRPRPESARLFESNTSRKSGLPPARWRQASRGSRPYGTLGDPAPRIHLALRVGALRRHDFTGNVLVMRRKLHSPGFCGTIAGPSLAANWFPPRSRRRPPRPCR